MSILEVITSNPQWVALFVAMGVLTYQQRQIITLQREAREERREQNAWFRERFNKLMDNLMDVPRKPPIG